MRRRVALAFAAAAFVATACGTRVDAWPEGALEPTDYYADRARSAHTDGDTDTDASDGDTTTTPNEPRRDGNGSASAPASDAALPAPAPGTYTYDQSGDGADPSSSTIAWAVERSAASVTMTSTETDDGGEFSATTTSRFRVTKTALELLSTTTEYDGETPDTCTYKPAILLLKLPLQVGARWKAKSACADEPSEEVEFSVTGTSNDVIGGKTVKTFVVTMRQSFDSTDDTTGERTTFSFEDTRHVDPTTLLTVIEDITFTVDGEKSTVRRKLRSLHPA